MKLWHDDIRRPPDHSWVWARTNNEAKSILSQNDVGEASLDHDMGMDHIDPDIVDADGLPIGGYLKGDSEDDGYQLVKWMVENDKVPEKVTIHSWNPDGAMRMANYIAENYTGICHIRVAPYRMD